MRVLVTGASGHIGKPTVATLLEAGHRVVGLAEKHYFKQHAMPPL